MSNGLRWPSGGLMASGIRDKMNNVAIIGLGLMGASIGLALKASGCPGRVRGFARRPDTRAQALRRGVVDEVSDDPAAAVRDADFVVFCVPVLSVVDRIRDCRAGLKRDAVLTDVGSTKVGIVAGAQAELAGRSVAFVGSHPIAGSEQQGLEAARGDLYTGATVVVTPTGGEPPSAVDRVDQFWRSLGASPLIMSPFEHDRIMARTSHLPHIVAAILARTVGRDGDLAQLASFCGPGFRDTTRIAEGSPDVWHDILRSNRSAIVNELQAFADALQSVADALQAESYEQIRAFLEKSRAMRKALAPHNSINGNRHEN